MESQTLGAHLRNQKGLKAESYPANRRHTLDDITMTSFFGSGFGKGYKVPQTFQSPRGSQNDAEKQILYKKR